MALSEADLDTILDYCRALRTAKHQLQRIDIARGDNVGIALDHWRGPHSETFNARIGDEGRDLNSRVEGLQEEADAWAKAWADTVNQINEDRREEAVSAEKNSRGFGQSFVDVFVGDDSDEMIRSYTPVGIPTGESNYAATGGLETFG